MLSAALIREIDRMLSEGELSQRKIAARLGISRGIVSAVASGQRGLHGKADESEANTTCNRAGPPIRCPHCGYRVFRPCLICSTREYRNEQLSQIRHRQHRTDRGHASCDTRSSRLDRGHRMAD
jgi:predicted XRE-type DNA-binding protein